jgi:ssDNA-binding Zn-finger/Zn-ribbon topoisomerase 1
MPERPPPDECDNCGSTIPRRARACPECGADERTGWRDTDDTRYDGLDLPDSAFGEKRQPSPRAPQVNGIAWYWWIAGLILLLALGLFALGSR